jgi:hypothetical protein
MTYAYRFDILAAADGSRAFPTLASPILRQIQELSALSGSSHLAATALFDPPSQRTHFCLLQHDGIVGEPCPSGNLGDPHVLLGYHQRADAIAPAERAIKIFSGHGLGPLDGAARQALSLSRCLSPDGSHKDFLDLDEVAHFIAQTKPAVTVFDACLMSNIESLAQLYVRGFRGFAVAALDEMSAKGLPLADAAHLIKDACHAGFCSDLLVAQAFVSPYKGDLPTDTAFAFQLSEHFAQGIEAFAAFVRSLANSPPAPEALLRAFRLASLRCFRGPLCDLGLLATALSSLSFRPSVIRPLQAAIQHFQAANVGKTVGTAYTDALGLSLFCPSSRHLLRQEAELKTLAFERKTRWLGFLEGLLS